MWRARLAAQRPSLWRYRSAAVMVGLSVAVAQFLLKG
jgi:hypothetical protein